MQYVHSYKFLWLLRNLSICILCVLATISFRTLCVSPTSLCWPDESVFCQFTFHTFSKSTGKGLEFSSSKWPVSVLQVSVHWRGSVPDFQLDQLSLHFKIFNCALVQVMARRQIPVAVRFKALFCGHSLGLQVRISPVEWKSVSFEYSVLPLIHSSPTNCVRVNECDQVQQ